MSEPLLIVGAGPTGLVLSIELTRRGIPHRLIERAAAPHAQSRATDIQSRTLEIFRDLGVDAQILTRGKKRDRISMWVGDKRLVEMTIEGVDSPFPYMIGLEQQHTEQVLERRLEELGGKVERAVRLATLEQDEDGVSAVLLYGDGRWRDERFAYVVGCDGAHSAVRHAMGFGFEGSAFEETFFLADIALEAWLPESETALVVSEAGMLIFLPIPGERWVRMFGDVDPEHEGAPIDKAFCQQVLARRTFNVAIADIGWTATFRVHSRQVESYRKRRVLLAGDAAHVHSPSGGHGMNTGIQDAYNLGWKLALVAQGVASDRLLDSYHAERHPIAKSLIGSTSMETRMALWRSRFGQEALLSLMGLAARLPPVQQRLLANALEIDVGYRASPIVGEQHESTLFSNVIHDDASEAPSVMDLRAFAAAPRPGDRAPDVKLPSGSLYDRLATTKHTLLLFDGRSKTEAGYDNLASIVALCREHHSELIDPYVVVVGAEKPAALKLNGELLFDDGALHDRYGAASECLYLIRPDGHVGFRSEPADGDALLAHVSALLAGGAPAS